MADPVREFAERVMPIQELSAWRDFQKRKPDMAKAMWDRAELVLFGFVRPLG